MGTGFGYSNLEQDNNDDIFKLYLGIMCFLKEERDPAVCSSSGRCVAHDTCICNEERFGPNCELTKCNGILSNETDKVCLQKGICLNSKCLCYEQSPYNNPDCSIDTEMQNLMENLWIYISIPFGIFFAIFVIVVILIILIFAGCELLKIKKKFDGIENVDLILEEAKIEQNSTNPKIKIDKSLFEIDFKDINLVSVLGDGGSNSVVYLAKWKGNYCAYKGFKSNGFGESSAFFKEFEKEVKIFSSIHHPSILQFYGACVNLPKVGILLEYCSNGDMNSFLNKYKLQKKESYPIGERIRLLKEVAVAMEYLHSIKVLHRDLKPENVLIDDNENAKIMDFGLSKLSSNEEKTMTKQIGTSYYMAPEVFGSGYYSNKCDVYSFAMLMFVIITEDFFPYGFDTKQSVILRKVSQSPEFRPKIKNEVFENCQFLIPLIKKNWNFDAKKRDSFKKIIKTLEEEEIKYQKTQEKREKGKKRSEEYFLKEISQLKKENQNLKKEIELLKK